MVWTCPACGCRENDDSNLRCSCGHENLIYDPPNYNKIDGGLVFVAGGLILSIIVTLSVYSDALAFATEVEKATLAIIGGIMLVIPLFLLTLLCKRKRSFPKYIKIWYLINVVLAYANFRTIKSAPELIGKVGTVNHSIDCLALTAIGCLFWLTYFFLSVRVKKTFVR